ncbi:MAG TPA: LacI family DNA-binding transcriptional regulator [Bacilli bacterium]|nr:LacI family DNA-binding transcriptional regulator [Bacilli bacterium]HOR53005.1 LacI family DNA-binding transcriptional regulator [Bacilli bacterium]
MSQQIKIYDVAGAAGVSLATVSRVLNHPEKVKAETRERVLKIIKEKGYKPNANARGLASKRSTTVAIVIPSISRASVAEMIEGIYDSARKYGYTIRLFITKDEEDPRDAWSEVIASSVDGILFMNDETTDTTYREIAHTPVPVVFVNNISSSDEFGSISIDYEECAYQITKEMIKRGNKKILFIDTIHKYSANELKAAGYERAMKEAGLEIDILYSTGNININQNDFKTYLNKKVPEVALAVRDSMAISFMNVATKKGIKVPEQLQVIGFQNTRYAVLSNPTLTCVAASIYDIGSRAMSYLTEMMKDEQKNAEERESYQKKAANITVDYDIVWRESTK